MLTLLLPFCLSYTVVAELPDSSESNPSCLLQTDRQRHRTPVNMNEHLIEAAQSLLSSSAQQSVVFDERLGRAGKPSGQTDMQKTTMSQEDLPTGSRHINQETYSSDWSSEYHPFVRSTIPSLPTQPTVAGEHGMHWAYWFLLLAMTGCLLMVCCCLALGCCRFSKREVHRSAPRQIDNAPTYVLPDHPFFPAYHRECMLAHLTGSPQHHAEVRPHHVWLPSHDELRPSPQTLSSRHHAKQNATTIHHPPMTRSDGYRREGAFDSFSQSLPRRDANSLALSGQQVSILAPVATVGVDSTGDGCADYLYAGIDRNNDGIPDSLQMPHVSRHVHSANVVGDGHAGYFSTSLNLNNDGISDSLRPLDFGPVPSFRGKYQ